MEEIESRRISNKEKNKNNQQSFCGGILEISDNGRCGCLERGRKKETEDKSGKSDTKPAEKEKSGKSTEEVREKSTKTGNIDKV